MPKYILPVADKNTLGGVKIGDYINVDENGRISVDLGSTLEEIESSLEAIRAGKALIAEAITDKGVETSSESSFLVLANNIEKISMDDGSVSNMYLV